MVYDYANVIKTGNGILRNLNPNAKTRFQVLQYLAEAYCMQGHGAQALECLKAEGATSIDAETKFRFDNLANGLKETTPVSAKTINLLNQSAVNLCTGQLEQAKQCFDQVLDAMELKLQTSDTESKQLIPAYIVNLLVYFHIKSKNYKMARQLLKSRRFLVDTNHIEAPGVGSLAQKARNKS
jgi:tetratricopeptide (TPR) repeat protein